MGPSESTVREALGLLLEGLPDDAVVEGMHAVAEVLRQTYRSVKLEPPAWSVRRAPAGLSGDLPHRIDRDCDHEHEGGVRVRLL